jgi:hypothetical protein
MLSQFMLLDAHFFASYSVVSEATFIRMQKAVIGQILLYTFVNLMKLSLRSNSGFGIYLSREYYRPPTMGWATKLRFQSDTEIIIFVFTSRSLLGPIQLPVPCVPGE